MSPKRAKPTARRARRAGKPARAAKPRPAAKRRAAAKRAPAKKRVTAGKSAPARRATLKLVARPAARAKRPPAAKAKRPAAAARKPASPRHKPFGGALAGASAKDLALFDLVRARVEVQAAIQGMVAASAEAPIAEGKWSPRQIVLHLHYWDREMLPCIEKAHRHNQRPPHTMPDILAENTSSQREFAAHDWDVARRLMQQSREALLEALQSLPEEPAEIWSGEHALGWLIRILSHHDRHHAAAIKEARTRTGTPG